MHRNENKVNDDGGSFASNGVGWTKWTEWTVSTDS